MTAVGIKEQQRKGKNEVIRLVIVRKYRSQKHKLWGADRRLLYCRHRRPGSLSSMLDLRQTLSLST